MSTDVQMNGEGSSGSGAMIRNLVIAVIVVMTFGAVIAARIYIVSLGCRPPALAVIDDPTQLDDRHLEMLNLDPPSWVRQYSPQRSRAGYNLVLYRRRVPLIIDMNGRVVHSWPEVRVTGRIRLNRDGSLAVIGIDNLIKEYSWDGKLTWHFQLPDQHHLPHHDLIRVRNGNYLVLAHDGHGHTDYLLEVDRDGSVVWEWWFEEHAADFPNWDPESLDPSHSNSIRELPPNPWYEGGDGRFKPGNILVSARSLNTIFIIDKASGDVVWTYSNGLDGQHEAVMVERGLGGPGLIMVFNNGLENRSDYRRSRVQVINPVTGELVWEYDSDFFFSSVGGTAQPLPGGNVLVTSSQGGRVFEVEGRERIVWEWAPPYLPMRVERVAYDHCPQLAGLPIPLEAEVVAEDDRPFVDSDLYTFYFKWETGERNIDGRDRRIIPLTGGCRDLRVPEGATVRTEFGLDGERVAGRAVKARFRLTIDDHQRPPETVVDAFIDGSSEPSWRRQTVSISTYALRQVSMCIETSVEGDLVDPAEVVFWSNPQILSKADRERRAARSKKISQQEQRLREQQLKALGYVD